MAHVELREGESVDNLRIRFRTAVHQAVILSDFRDHRYFQSKVKRVGKMCGGG